MVFVISDFSFSPSSNLNWAEYLGPNHNSFGEYDSFATVVIHNIVSIFALYFSLFRKNQVLIHFARGVSPFNSNLILNEIHDHVQVRLYAGRE